MTSNQTSNGSSAQRKFAYDRWGNRTTMWQSVFGGTPIQTITLEQSGGAPTNRITSVANSGTTVNYLYDATGNVINDGVHGYTYAENEPIDATDPLGLNLAVCSWRLVSVVWGGEDGVFYAVIGLVSEGCVDGGGGGGGGFGTVIPPPKQPRVRPKPKPLGPAKFSEQKFRDCAHQLYDRRAGASIVDKFLDSRGNGTGPYQATFDYSMTAAQIGQMLYDEGITAVNREQM